MDESLFLMQRDIRQLLLLFKKNSFFQQSLPCFPFHPEEPGGNFFYAPFIKKTAPLPLFPRIPLLIFYGIISVYF